MFLTSGCVLTTFLTTYIADGKRPKSHKNITFLVPAETFLCFQAGRSSATFFGHAFFGVRSYCIPPTKTDELFFCFFLISSDPAVSCSVFAGEKGENLI